ncbi:uncharacterized protein [Notamacropus eugenii]|uniref:uncharacterized protein isoform X2 n=1 Tax=Notamacropus eugenii TaxID=9315 RepID=UPI003B6710C7
MNRFTMYVWVVFWFLSLQYLLHISFIYSAPVNFYEPSKKSFKRFLDTDEKLFKVKQQLLPNNIKPDPTDAHVDVEEANTEPNEYLEDRTLERKEINWNDEIIFLGCLSFLFAITGGATLWFAIYRVKQEEISNFGNLAENLMFLSLLKELDTSELKERLPKATRKEREFKTVLHSVLKTERKKKRRKRRRSDPTLVLIKEETLNQKKRGSRVNTQDMKIPDLNDGEKIQDDKGKNQVQLSSHLLD